MEQVMRKHMQRERMPARENAKAEVVALDDGWIWGVIFATTALTALALATLFTVSAG
jgi:hypothetical protein